MRGDTLGGGDVGAMPGDAWEQRDPSGVGDGGISVGERDGRMVGRLWSDQLDTSDEQGGDGVGERDGAREQHGAGRIHTEHASRALGMRGDALGGGDVGAMPGDAWSEGKSAGVGDGGISIGERHRRMVGGDRGSERIEAG